MKKIFIFLMIICTLLISCEKPNDDNLTKENQALSTITIQSEVYEDITLVKNVNGFQIVWTSNNDAINEDGKVTRKSEDVTVTLNARVLDTSANKDFIVVVKALEYNYDNLLSNAITKAKESLNEGKIINEIVEDDKKVILSYEFSNDKLVSNNEFIMPETEDESTKITITAKYEDKQKEEIIDEFVVLGFYTKIENIIESKINIPTQTDSDINLPTEIDGISFQWSTNNEYLLDGNGKVYFTEEAKEVSLFLVCEYYYGEYEYIYDKTFTVQILPYSGQKRINFVIDSIKFDSVVTNNLVLETEFSYGVKGSWKSSNENVITTNGFVNPQGEDTLVKLTLTLEYLSIIKQVTFDVLVSKIDLDGCDAYFGMHNLIDRVNNFETKNFTNLKYNDFGKLVIEDGYNTGIYESKVFKTRDFTSLVGSYSCVTNENATCELEVSLRVNGTWSKYISYGAYGLGRNNLYYDTEDSYVKLSTDEVNVKNSKTADAIKYRITMKKLKDDASSPALSLVAFALKIPNYVYNINVSNLPAQKDNDLPKLYQHDVPTIGGSICSATTTTMLLKWKGFDFTNKGYQFEHQFMAAMVADRGHNNPTYGNWSYNMITAGAFGVDAYVARMYSWDEVKYHLNNVGPMGASIKGNFGTYTTNGHLIVVRGYRETANGTIVICNDPNIRGVYYEVTLSIFMNAWRNISYVIE